MIEPELLTEIPTLLTDEPLVQALDDWNKPKHYWHLLVWLENQRGKGGQFTDEQIDKGIYAAQRHLANICKRFQAKFMEDRSFLDRRAKHWRTNQSSKEDVMHYHDSGAIPPRILCWPADVPMPTQEEEQMECYSEIGEWAETPTAKGFFGEEELQKMRDNSRQMVEHCWHTILSRKGPGGVS